MRALSLVLLLAACAPAARTPAPVDRIAAECALLAQAAAQMAAPHPGLREGCPGVEARDSRPLPAQMASLREATAAPLPPGITPGTRAETVFRRLITRGVPAGIAAGLTARPEFAAASR